MRRTLGDRTYLLIQDKVLPERPDLLLFFHGSMQSGNVIRRFTAGTFDAACPLVAYPFGVHQHFNDARLVLPVKARELGVDDVAFTRDLVASLRQEFGVGRVFAAGFSNGGQMVMRLLFDTPGLLDGAAVFASALGAGSNHAPTNPDSAYKPTPVLFIHGTADPLAPYAGGSSQARGDMLGAVANAERFAQLNGAGPASTRCPYPDVTVTRWGGAHPVELWSVDGMGHVVPSGNQLDPRLGRNTSSFLAAEVVRGFFGERSDA
ncbi:LpqC [Corynebacterium phocae]|uniref:LpqC n=1 Tax=Corynebacterium phocae TaxID=161895 RepID=A0A1L7D1F6_9CORY|nr:hypothetical protein [Corynebacterium phocae]APT91917.1 LpqC [Corynebacterium phocae]KAA8727373.1 hypothetical protein F4V58_01735 [Corynebacterium phocae]